MWQSAQMQMLAAQEAIIEEAEAHKEERQRAAAASVAAGEAATLTFLRQRRGEPLGRTLQQVLSDAASMEDPVELDHRRCRAELDRFLAQGGDFAMLRERLGTVAAATRSNMADQQTRMRARFEAAEAAKSALERRVEEQDRTIGALRARAERLEGAVGGLESYR